MGLFDKKEEVKLGRTTPYDKLYSLSNKDAIYSTLHKLACSDDFLHNVPLAYSALIKPFEKALGAGVRFERNNERLQQRLAFYNTEMWLKQLYMKSLFDDNACLALQTGEEGGFILTTVKSASQKCWPFMQLKNVVKPTLCLKELCVQVKILDELIFDMALSGSRLFLKFDNVEAARDQESLLRGVSQLERRQSLAKMAVLVGATPVLTSIDTSHLLNAKSEIMRSVASITGVPVSVLSEAQDSSSVFSGTGESFERYKLHLKYLQESILFYAYNNFIKLINQKGSVETFAPFTMVNPLAVNAGEAFNLYQQEVKLAIEVDNYLNNHSNRKDIEKQLENIKQKYM